MSLIGVNDCLCKREDCYYHRDLDSRGAKFCAFCYITSIPRNESVEDCTVYKPMSPKEKEKAILEEQEMYRDYKNVKRRPYAKRFNEV